MPKRIDQLPPITQLPASALIPVRTAAGEDGETVHITKSNLIASILTEVAQSSVSVLSPDEDGTDEILVEGTLLKIVNIGPAEGDTAYTRKIQLEPATLSGARAMFVVKMPDSDNPTIDFYNGDADDEDNKLFSMGSDNRNDYVNVEFYFNGENWVLINANVVG